MCQPGEKYRPSNGTEGMWFMENHCDQCIHQHPDPDHPMQCDLIMRSMCYDQKDKEYPEEWTYTEAGEPTCTKYKHWDWGKEQNRVPGSISRDGDILPHTNTCTVDKKKESRNARADERVKAGY